MPKANPKYKCKLLPFKKVKILTSQEVSQQLGWGITAFDLPKVWEHSQGEDVKIAVLDTGVDLCHDDLVKNLLPGINFIKPGQPPQDDCGHGCHISGILVAINNDIGMVGVCPKAKVIPVKVLDNKGNGNLLAVSTGIRWAADNGADFIQMSLGAPQKVQQVAKAIQYAADKGVITFCAAGNAGNTKEIFYPANYKTTISVAAINENFKRANFSCTGQNLDFMAPGVNILSTIPNNSYCIMSGTSMSCPYLCGIAALALSWARNTGKFTLNTAEDYRNLFRQYTIPLTDETLKDQKFYQGFGIIDPRKVHEALEAS